MRASALLCILLVLTGAVGSRCAAKDSTPSARRLRALASRLDEVLKEHTTRVGARASVLSLSRQGQLVYARGFGWLDRQRKRKTQRDSAFRIASVSKPITAILIRDLVARGRLQLEAKVHALLKDERGLELQPLDTRLEDITVEHLLDHKGGWDRAATFDPVFGLPGTKPRRFASLSPADLVQIMWSRPLQFDPGSRSVYSNFGYVVLGRVLEAVTKKPYAEYLSAFMEQNGIAGIAVGQQQRNQRWHEPEYPAAGRRLNIEVMDAAGGLIATAPALCTLLGRFWMDGRKRKGGSCTYTFYGSNPGTSAVVRQHPGGFEYAAMFNDRRGSHPEDNEALSRKLDALLESFFGE